LKHAVLRADLNQHVKKGVYHIQNVSSIHHRLKKWIDNTFLGGQQRVVSTSECNFFVLQI
jgi:hypothetical protein